MRDDKALLAIETGGSRGRAALALGGRIVERTLAVGLNPNDTGFDLFEERLRELTIPLLSPLRIARKGNPPLDAVVGIAGAGDPLIMKQCKSILEPILKPYGSLLRLKAMTDVGALAWACIGDGTGVVLIAGTGSICMGVGRRGGRRMTWRAGGKGSFLDHGSGSDVGLIVLDAALATVERRYRGRLLVKLICDRYGIEPQEIRSHFIPLDRQKVAGLARIAFEACDLGDSFARTVIRGAARDLVELVQKVKEKGRFRKGMKVIASGGLFSRPIMCRMFSNCIGYVIPGTRLTFIDDSLMRILGGLMKVGSGREL